AQAAVAEGRPTRVVRIAPVIGGSLLIRSTLRTETAVRCATARCGIPAARRAWISCRVMASITPPLSRSGAPLPPEPTLLSGTARISGKGPVRISGTRTWRRIADGSTLKFADSGRDAELSPTQYRRLRRYRAAPAQTTPVARRARVAGSGTVLGVN